MDNESEEVN